MRACLWMLVAALGACGGVAATPSDGGAADVVEAAIEAGADATFDAGQPHDAALPDALPKDALDEPPQGWHEGGGCGALSSPTFSPPDGTAVLPGSAVTITPAADFPPDGTIFFTTNGTIPNTSSAVYIGPILINQPTTIFAIAGPPGGSCHAASPPVHASYSLAEPGGWCGDLTPVFATAPQTQAHPFQVSLSVCPGATGCYRYDGNTPTCSNGTCTGGSLTYDANKGIPVGPAETDPVTGKVTLTAILCDGAGNATPVASQVDQLALAAPYLASANADGAGLPGWDWSGKGAPSTTMTIPADAGVGPYGPFVAQQVGSLPCTSATSCTGTANTLAGWLCWSKGATVDCNCASPLPLTSAATSATLPAAANVSPGDTVAVIACGANGYAPSAVTAVHF